MERLLRSDCHIAVWLCGGWSYYRDQICIQESAHSQKQIVSLCHCEALIGRSEAYLVQEVEEKRLFPGQKREENSLPSYAAQIELAATISCALSQASKR